MRTSPTSKTVVIEWCTRYKATLLVRFDSGSSLREGVGRALDIVGSLGSALELAADLARESTPARDMKFRHLFNGLGKGISRALDLRGARDSTLHLPARLSRQPTPIAIARNSGSMDNGGSHHGSESSEGELHFAGLFENDKDDDNERELVLWISESSDDAWELSWILLTFSKQES